MIMAGMFYSLKEAAEKLNITEEQVRELAKQGKIREFRDGSNLLFKIEEVEELMSDTSIATAHKQTLSEPEETEEPIEEAAQAEEAQEPESEQQPSLESEEAEVSEPSAQSQKKEPEEKEPAGKESEEEEISIASESGVSTEADLTNLDTAVTGQGVSVLGETDRDYKLTDDTLAETIGPTGTTGEASLEEIEEDVNLDSFGSGSGLLDLSLQADDTSLGGILNEIYTTEGEEEGQEPSEPSSAIGLEEPEQEIGQEQIAVPEIVPEAQAIGQIYAEPEPDTQSNALGALLFLPLLILLYTAIVTLAAQRGFMPSILGVIHGFIWYIVIGAIVITGLAVGAAFMLGGNLALSKRQKKTMKPKDV
jgi:excisionase family DNA binding protein